MTRLLEVCVDSPEGLHAAVEGRADRVELCAALALGGLTPTAALMEQAVATGIRTAVMIRPRQGDFVWSSAEVGHMRGEIRSALAMGMDGIVIGANRVDGTLDDDVLASLIGVAGAGVERVLHRAIDLTPDPVAAVETAITLGFDRILTSGGAVRALDGLAVIRAMVQAARGRITIMPGSGLTAANVGELLAVVPVDQVHASCALAHAQNPRAVAMGFTAPARRETDVTQVRAMRTVLDQWGSKQH